MNKAIKITAVIMALVMTAAMFCACQSSVPADSPDEAKATEQAAENTEVSPTDAPETTDEPAATEAPAPSQKPEGKLGFVAVPLNFDYAFDLDLDGTDEKIRIGDETDSNGDHTYTVLIDSNFGEAEYVLDYCYEAYAMIVTDEGGGRPSLMLCTWHDSSDPTTYVYRIGGGEMISYDCYLYFTDPEEKAPIEDGLLALYVRTEIMGTCYVKGLFTVNDENVALVSEDYSYVGGPSDILVVSELPVTMVDDETGEMYDITVAPGTKVDPISTDLETYAYVLLSTGENAYVRYDSAEYPLFIKGVPQNEYLGVLYCD